MQKKIKLIIFILARFITFCLLLFVVILVEFITLIDKDGSKIVSKIVEDISFNKNNDE